MLLPVLMAILAHIYCAWAQGSSSSSSALDSGSGRALWVWSSSSSPIRNESNSDRFFAWAASERSPVRTVLLESEHLRLNSSSDIAAFRTFVDRAAASGMCVAALYGSRPPIPSSDVLVWLDVVLSAFRAPPSESPSSACGFWGISLDIEPNHQSPSSYQTFAELLIAVRHRIDAANALSTARGRRALKLSIAGSWAYAEARVDCGPKMKNVEMLDCAVSLVNVYYLMNYRNNAYGCFCKPPPARNPARYECPADGRPIPGNCSATPGAAGGGGSDGMIGHALASARAVRNSSNTESRLGLGIETSCFSASDPADLKYQYKLSFCGTSVAYMEQQMNETEVGLRAAGLWDDVADPTTPWAVEDYDALVALEQKP